MSSSLSNLNPDLPPASQLVILLILKHLLSFEKGLFSPHDGVLTFINISLDLEICYAEQLPNEGRNQLYVFPLCFVMKHVYVYIKVLLLCGKPIDVLKLRILCNLFPPFVTLCH